MEQTFGDLAEFDGNIGTAPDRLFNSPPILAINAQPLEKVKSVQ